MHQQSPISPGWLLLIIFVLWGLAGKLDEPLEGWPEAEPQRAVDVAVSESPGVRLLCRPDEAASAPPASGRDPHGRFGPVLFSPSLGSRQGGPHLSFGPLLRCVVVNE